MNDKNNMLALSQERFSARKFTPEAVSQEDLIISCSVCVWHYRQ